MNSPAPPFAFSTYAICGVLVQNASKLTLVSDQQLVMVLPANGITIVLLKPVIVNSPYIAMLAPEPPFEYGTQET